LFYCCVAIRLFAKKDYEFSFDTARRIYNVGSYNSVRVIDLRPKQDNFGTIRKGVVKRNLTTADSFSNAIAAYGTSLTRDWRYTDKNELLVLLYQFELQHHISGAVSTVYIYAAYFIGDETGKYQHLFTVDEFFESADMEPEEEINKLFFDFFQTASIAHLAMPGKVEAYTLQQAINRLSDLKTKYAVYNTTAYKKGVYYTLEQFLNNTPGDTDFIESDHYLRIGNSPTFFHTTERGGKGPVLKEKDFFAVYNGERWFKSTPHGNFGMRKDGDDFVFKSELKGIDGYRAFSVSGSIIAFGVVGAIVSSAANKAAVRKYDTAPSTDKRSSKEKIFYELKVDCFKNQYYVVRRLQ